MKIDMYGSRSLLINLIKFRSILDIEINNAFIGTTMDSQLKKEVNLIESRLKKITSNYEILEIRTDFEKRFRKFHNFSKSNIMIMDFMQEGKQAIEFDTGTLVDRPVLLRYGYNKKKSKKISQSQKVDRIKEYVDTMSEYLSTYDKIIINKSRTPKYIDKKQRILKENIEEVNFLNFYAETFEDLLMRKLNNIEFISEYKQINDLENGYLQEKSYTDYLISKLDEIIQEEKEFI